MNFSPIYLYLGTELGEKKDTIEKLRKNIKNAFGQIDSYVYYASEDSLASVISVLENGALFSTARFVVIRNAELIKKKDDIQHLNDWIETAKKLGAQNDAFLVLDSDKNSVDNKLDKLIAKEHKKIFWEMFENRKEQWLSSWFSKNNLTITPDAIETILELVENNTEALRNECSRFPLCFDQGHCVTAEDVENVLSHNREESAFTLFNALADNEKTTKDRLSVSLSILQKLRQVKSANGIQIIAGLTYCYRKLRTWQLLHENANPSPFDLKINGFSSKKAQSQYRGASYIWNQSDIVAILALLSSTDMSLRSGGARVEDNVLQTMLYCIVMKKGLPIEN
ncbi:MAG: DNA polymerase III subunit delta [Treponema sp. CETP13]|nr:MAG: DNA polymerase III subunit delta [Treponema sp. CETP13]